MKQIKKSILMFVVMLLLMSGMFGIVVRASEANASQVPPKPTSIISLTSPVTGKFQVKWYKISLSSGYQIQYATNRQFSGAKTVKITNKSTVSKTISKLASEKTYYVRMRTYRWTTKFTGKEILYSRWSKIKSVKIKLNPELVVKKYLSGKWYQCGGQPYVTTAKFTAKKCTYTYYNGRKKSVTVSEIVKTNYGYFIKILDGKTKYGYRYESYGPNSLTYVGTWDPYSMKGYSGSSSLYK